MSGLRGRRFVLLIAGQAVNEIGSWCALVALWGYSAYRYHAAPWQIAIVVASLNFSAAVLGPLAGVPIDRFGPRRVILVADSVAAVVALSMAFTTEYWQLIPPTLVLSLCASFTRPAWSALPPKLVDDRDLQRANALLGLAGQSSIAFGPILGAVAISLWGPRGAFLINSVTFLLGVAVTLPLHVPHTASPPAHLRHEVAEGLRVVRQRPDVVRLLVVSCSVYSLWGSFATLEPLYVRDVLHRPPAYFAWLQSAFGLMLFTFAIVAARVGDRAATRRTVALTALGSGVFAATYLGTSYLAVAFVAIALWGVATAWFNPTVVTLVQRATPKEFHGRVFAVDGTLRAWTFLLGGLLSGAVATAASVHAAAWVFAAVPVAGGLWYLRSVARGPAREHAPRVDAGVMAVVPADQ
jgi:MFS family permease